MIASLSYVRPDENYARNGIGVLSATSAQVGYEASRAGNGRPVHPWWATSGTASLTATYGATQVDIVALIHSNVDAGRTVTIGGTFAGTISGSRQANGYPRNIALIGSGAGGSATVSVAGNSVELAIGELVVGRLRAMAYPLQKGARRKRSRIVQTDTDSYFGDEIRIDVGAELWQASGHWMLTNAEFTDFEAWWESTRGGTLPTLIIPNDVDNQPRLCRMTADIEYSNDGGYKSVDVTFDEVARGIEVV